MYNQFFYMQCVFLNLIRPNSQALSTVCIILDDIDFEE